MPRRPGILCATLDDALGVVLILGGPGRTSSWLGGPGASDDDQPRRR